MSIRRALDYPYDIPDKSYMIIDGEKKEWSKDFDLSGRVPVLACGSNQSPTQLKRKFPEGTIPVMAGWLEGYDSVYSAHFTSYGSIAATYHNDNDVCSRQMVTWLTDGQLQQMHESEALGVNYIFEEMAGLSFTSDCDKVLSKAYAYLSTRGPLKLNGQPVGLKSIDARGRPYDAQGEEELQRSLLKRLDDQKDLTAFVLETIEDKILRLERTRKLVELSS